ncbi:MAG: DUF1501 domain-containing protein, partial [Verrucomicrobiota bacterium]
MKLEHLINEARFRALEDETRRQFITRCTTGLGALFLANQAQAESPKHTIPRRDQANPLSPLPPHYPTKAKRVIYLHMIGAPSQLELFDYKPDLQSLDGQPCPQSFLEGKNF